MTFAECWVKAHKRLKRPLVMPISEGVEWCGIHLSDKDRHRWVKTTASVLAMPRATKAQKKIRQDALCALFRQVTIFGQRSCPHVN